MLNSFNATGRLTKDPELKYTPQGNAVATFTLAINRVFKTDGQPEADYIVCTAWRKTAESISNYVKKGHLVGISGRMQSRSYEGQDGKRVYITECMVNDCIFLESKENKDTPPQYNQYRN